MNNDPINTKSVVSNLSPAPVKDAPAKGDTPAKSGAPVPAKKEKKRRIRKIFTRYFNPKRILAVDQIKSCGEVIRESSRGLFTVKEATRIETFDEAKQRLNLTEADITKKTKQFLIMATAYICLAGLTFVYVIYLWIVHSFLALLLAVVLVFFLLANALREHFWYMQMTLRRLGCDFSDWRKFVLHGKNMHDNS